MSISHDYVKQFVYEWTRRNLGYSKPAYEVVAAANGFFCTVTVKGLNESGIAMGLSKKAARTRAAQCLVRNLIRNEIIPVSSVPAVVWDVVMTEQMPEEARSYSPHSPDTSPPESIQSVVVKTEETADTTMELGTSSSSSSSTDLMVEEECVQRPLKRRRLVSPDFILPSNESQSNHLEAIVKRIAAVEQRLSDLEQRLSSALEQCFH